MRLMLPPGSVVKGSGGQRWTVEKLLGTGTCCHVYQATVQGEEAKVGGSLKAMPHDNDYVTIL